MELHRRFQIDPVSDLPRIKVLSTCTHLIRTLSGLPLSKTNPEDVDTKADDHAYDALRYMIMSRPRIQGALDRLRFIKKEIYAPSDSTFGY